MDPGSSDEEISVRPVTKGGNPGGLQDADEASTEDEQGEAAALIRRGRAVVVGEDRRVSAADAAASDVIAASMARVG